LARKLQNKMVAPLPPSVEVSKKPENFFGPSGVLLM
jgi:hypothetical protein